MSKMKQTQLPRPDSGRYIPQRKAVGTCSRLQELKQTKTKEFFFAGIRMG
jgi:hypothetical protein